MKNGEFKLNVRYSFKMISSINKDHDILVGPFTNKFTLTANSWGSPNVLSLTHLKDENEGLLENGMIKLKLDVTFVE